MSFSGDVREELEGKCAEARHCNLAELSAFLIFNGSFFINKFNKPSIKFHTENVILARKCFTLIEKTFNIDKDVLVRRNMKHGSCSYDIFLSGEELLAIKNAVIRSSCCKRSFIRGAYIAGGSMSDPNSSYHFEIVCNNSETAEKLQGYINDFGLDARIVTRKKTYVVYLKEADSIVEILNVMEAHRALMEFENVRIYKGVANAINRKVNCETANIGKTVSAAVKQTEDIRLIQEMIGFEKLPQNLRDVAAARLEFPEASLKELGQHLENPVGKSGVNHRLRKLSEIADRLRESVGGY
ncbi:MAG: DNA-binding protein WhiA [Dorea sp.]|nr:DNA-binding protein WhiA [Dorea sp.]